MKTLPLDASLADAIRAINAIREELGARNATATVDLLGSDISCLELDNRSEKCLRAQNVHRVIQLVVLREDQLRRFKNLGQTSIKTVAKSLKRVGLRLGMRFDEKGREIFARGSEYDYRDMPINDLKLSARARNILLWNARVFTLGELLEQSESDLLAKATTSKTRIAEIKSVLADLGYSLRQTV